MGLTRMQKAERDYCIYFIRCPRTGIVRYIGLTSNASVRLSNHSGCVDSACRDWISSLKEKPLFEVVTGPMSIASARLIETRLIYLHSVMYPGRLLNREQATLEVRTIEVVVVSRKYAKHHRTNRRLEQSP